jgi:hypothetical protein
VDPFDAAIPGAPYPAQDCTGPSDTSHVSEVPPELSDSTGAEPLTTELSAMMCVTGSRRFCVLEPDGRLHRCGRFLVALRLAMPPSRSPVTNYLGLPKIKHVERVVGHLGLPPPR